MSRMNSAALREQIQSRDCCAYMYRAMQLVGWIPPVRGISRYVYLAWTCMVFALSTLYLPIGLILSIALDFEHLNLREFYGVLQIAFNTVGVSIKTIILLISLKRLEQTKNVLDKLDERLQSEGGRRRIQRAAAHCNNVFLTYCLVFLAYTVSVIMAGIVNGQPPWLVYNPYLNWRDSVANLWTQSLLEYVLGSGAIFICAITDSYAIIFVMIFRAHLDILKNNIRNLRTNPLRPESDNYKDLVCCIKDYELILNCCNIMRPVLSRTIFTQFLLVGIVLGINLINIQYFTDIAQVIASIVNFSGNLLETFPFCYLCDMLTQDAHDLSNLLVHSNWIDAEVKYKTTLKMFINIVQQPITFTAGDVFPISMETNMKLAEFAFSVMTLVNNIKLTEQMY